LEEVSIEFQWGEYMSPMNLEVVVSVCGSLALIRRCGKQEMDVTGRSFRADRMLLDLDRIEWRFLLRPVRLSNKLLPVTATILVGA